MDAKEKAFREAAIAEGYSDEDINAHLAKSSAKPQTPTVEAPTPVAEGPSSGFGANVEAKATQERQRLAADKKIREDAFAIPEWMLPAAAAGAGGAALAGGKAVYKSLSDKMADAPPVRTEPVFGDVPARVPGEPTLDVQALAPQPAAPAAVPVAQPKPTIADLQQRLGVAPSPSGIPPITDAIPPFERITSEVAPVAPVALPATPVAEVPVSPIATPTSAVMETPENPVAKAAALVEDKAPTPVVNKYDVTTPVVPPPEVTPGAAAILETQTPAATAVTAKQEKKIKGAVAPTGPIETVKTGSGLNAYLGQGAAKERIPSAFKTAAEIPAGYAFVPGMDVSGMNTARNRLGQEGYTEFVKAKGVPFGTYDETQKVLKSLDENRIGPTLTREQRKTIGAPMLPTTTGIKGKPVVVGGAAGALFAVPDLVFAGQTAVSGDMSKAGGQAAEIGSGLLPVPLQAAIFSGGTNVGEQAQIDYLRRMQQAKTRGAGNRGMAYDPRIPYNPQFMDVGIPPPFNR